MTSASTRAGRRRVRAHGYASCQVPGLLRTEAYARALVTRRTPQLTTLTGWSMNAWSAGCW